jgi:acetyl-CoA acetyltransferase
MISSPLHLLDCCGIDDGAAAVLIAGPGKARALPKAPVFVLGAGEGFTHCYTTWMPDMTTTGASLSGRLAFQMAGLAPRDVSTVQIYDAFTILPIVLLEDLGFCPKGEGGAFVESGSIALGGSLPMNTDGGGLSHCQNGSSGMWHLVEAIRQVRGERDAAQVPNANVALVHTNGGYGGMQSTVILGAEDTL